MNVFQKLLVVILATTLFASLITQIPFVSAQSGANTKTLKMIVPYGKGGGSDQLSRAMAKSVEEVTDIRFEIENIKRGSGLGGIEEFMKYAPDGNTVIEHIDDVASATAIGAIKIHPAKDWHPLAIVQLTFSQIYINANETRFHDWPTFLAYAKKNPRKVVVANVSYDGSMENMTIRQLETALGFKTRQVSFENIKDRYESVLLGRADVLFEQPGDISSYLKEKKLKPIVTFFNTRPKLFPDVPTHKEIGAKFEPLLRFRGFFVRKGISKERLKFLQEAFAKGYQTQSFQKFNESKFMTAVDPFRNPEQAANLINLTIKNYTKAYEAYLAETLEEFFKE